MKKALLTALLAISFAVFAVVPAGAIVGEIIVLDGVKYKVISDAPSPKKVVIYGHTDDVPNNLVIPAEVKGYSVTSSEIWAFMSCVNLISVDIRASLPEIAKYMFWGCENLNSVVIPSSVTSIGYEAFSLCRCLSTIDIPASVTEIDEYAFQGCRSLASIGIPASVTEIDFSAFDGCKILASIDVDPGNPKYASSDGVAFNKDLSVLFCCPDGKKGDYQIPASVTQIGYGAFNSCNGLTSINIPESVISIGGSAFYECSGLRSIKLPESVTSVGSYAFANCTKLDDIVIPASVTSIGVAAFEHCNYLMHIDLPSIPSIEDRMFYGCASLTSMKIPASVTSIGDEAFLGCANLTSVEIPGSVVSFGNYAFGYCRRLDSIICAATTPPAAEPNTFEMVDKTNCVLYVPLGCADAYRTAEYWDGFRDYVEKEFSGVESVGDDSVKVTVEGDRVSVVGTDDPVMVYDLGGRKILTIYGCSFSLPQGICILKVAGRTYKLAI